MILQTHPKQIWAGLPFTQFALKWLSQHTEKTFGRGSLYIMTFRSPANINWLLYLQGKLPVNAKK